MFIMMISYLPFWREIKFVFKVSNPFLTSRSVLNTTFVGEIPFLPLVRLANPTIGFNPIHL